MNNKIKDIDIKNHTYYFFDDIINIKIFDPDKVTIDEKLYKSILICYTGYVTIKDLKYVKINSVNPLYHIIDKVNGYLKEINKSKYSTLVHTNDCKKEIKKCEEWQIKIRYLIRSITKNSNYYDKKSIKFKFNLDDEIPLNKKKEIPSMVIVVRAVFHENNKYYPQVFLDECLYKLRTI